MLDKSNLFNLKSFLFKQNNDYLMSTLSSIILTYIIIIILMLNNMSLLTAPPNRKVNTWYAGVFKNLSLFFQKSIKWADHQFIKG